METLLSRCEIPIIDLQHMGLEQSPSKSALRRISAQLARSLSEKGLAMLVNHGIPEKKLGAVYASMDAFCALPVATKNKYGRDAADNHGYVTPGAERFTQGHVEEVRHAFNVSCLDRKLPEAEAPGFQAAVTALGHDFRSLALLLLRALAMGLGMPHDFFLNTHGAILRGGNASCMRLLYYPPFGAPPTPGVTRCGEHADYGTFTLLAQDCEGGLEVLLNNKWGRVGHLPGAILVNTGEMLAVWTGGRYPALRHRVVLPEQAMVRCKGRHSVAFFVHPDDDTPILPMEHIPAAAATTTTTAVADPPRAKQRSIYTAYQHLQMRFRETYAS